MKKADTALVAAQEANDAVHAIKAESQAMAKAQKAAILASKAKECAERAEDTYYSINSML